MTARMDTVFHNHDEQVIREVARMAELGYIDKEFVIYGCAYWAEGKRHYLTTRHLEKAQHCLETQTLSGRISTLPYEVTKTASVPLGEDEEVVRSLKRQTARELQQAYSADFFEALAKIAAAPASDAAYSLLETMREAIDGYFDMDILCLFDGLVETAYAGKVLTSEKYHGFKGWLAAINRQLLEESPVHDIFHKTFYTIAMILPNGKLKYYTNAQRDRIMARKLRLENEGKIVSPIFEKIWGYNYDYDLIAARGDHDKLMPELLSVRYMEKVSEIRSLPSAADVAAFENLAQQLAQSGTPLEQEALHYYRNLWHVS